MIYDVQRNRVADCFLTSIVFLKKEATGRSLWNGCFAAGEVSASEVYAATGHGRYIWRNTRKTPGICWLIGYTEIIYLPMTIRIVDCNTTSSTTGSAKMVECLKKRLALISSVRFSVTTCSSRTMVMKSQPPSLFQLVGLMHAVFRFSSLRLKLWKMISWLDILPKWVVRTISWINHRNISKPWICFKVLIKYGELHLRCLSRFALVILMRCACFFFLAWCNRPEGRQKVV